MDSTEIRFKNYKILINRLADANSGVLRGVLVQFSELTGIPQRQLSHINTRRRNIGAATARAIEKGFGEPSGWLDVIHTSSVDKLSEDEETRRVLELAKHLYEQAPKELQAALIKLSIEQICKQKLITNIENSD